MAQELHGSVVRPDCVHPRIDHVDVGCPRLVRVWNGIAFLGSKHGVCVGLGENILVAGPDFPESAITGGSRGMMTPHEGGGKLTKKTTEKLTQDIPRQGCSTLLAGN